jgi:hypothetical protein
MIIYRTAAEPIDPHVEVQALARRLASLPGSVTHDALLDLFIDAAELAAAVADVIFPHKDGCSPVCDDLGAMTAAAARAVVLSWQNEDPAPAVSELAHAAKVASAVGLPRSAIRRVSEGYAYYALHPETYAAAALQFAHRMRPHSVVCIGIRTIGSGLAAIVAAALQTVGVAAATYSVRPRGHPFNRTLDVRDDLRAALGDQPPHAHYLIVDEGPGISGTSFSSVVSWLGGLGIPPDRVHLFPSWKAAPVSLRSSEARAAWDRHAKWHVAPEEAKLGLARFVQRETVVDLSGGAWRHRCYAGEPQWPAVMPQHERLKALLPERAVVVRFAGLGRYGRARQARAALLADANLGVMPASLSDGYLLLPFEAGRPCVHSDADASLLRQAARHIAFLQRACPAEPSPAVDELFHMTEINIRETDASVPVPPIAVWRAALGSAPAAALDGRMQAHEWVRTETTFLKVDALDHHADHFFPGTQDPAWDLAAMEAEFRLDPERSRSLIDSYRTLSDDRDVHHRLPYHRLAYAAFQIGYAAFARQSLGETPEGRRFARREVFFRDRLSELTAARSQ